MAKNKDVIEVRGRIEDLLPGAKFYVKLDTGNVVMAHLAGKLHKNRIRVGVGDEVMVELTPYDLNNGRITFRF